MEIKESDTLEITETEQDFHVLSTILFHQKNITFEKNMGIIALMIRKLFLVF